MLAMGRISQTETQITVCSMASTPEPVPRQPIGAAIRRTDESRARAAEVTEADVLNARLLWMRNAPPGWAGLIEARRGENQGI
jgi:hypothetical protein